MDRGTYAAASSGLASLTKLEIVNNNLANVNTPGFKKQVVVTEEQKFENTFAAAFEKDDQYARGDHLRTPGATDARAVTDFSQGPIKNTGNPLDVALRQPDQFFAIQTPDGTQYTRAGNFMIGDGNTIVTADGMPVVGGGGPITVDGPGIKIESDGGVFSGTTRLGEVQVVQISNPQDLQRVGNSRFAFAKGAPQNAVAVDPSLESGSLEMANVSAISSVVDMITAQRGFEMYTRTAQSIDQLNQAAISQIGRAR